MHPTSRPAGYKHVRAIGDDVQSLNKIEIPKNKNFQNFHFFHPIGTPGRANSLTFYSFKNITKSNRKCDVWNRSFSIPGMPMAQKGAPTVAGTSQNWAQNASQSTQNPLQKCTGQPYIHTGNAKIADFIAVENQMKIWIIKSHVFHFPVCVSGSSGRPRRPKNTENWSKNSNFFQEPCRVHSSAVRTSWKTILCAF